MPSNSQLVSSSAGRPAQVKLTPYVLFCCLMASAANFVYGYDLVVAGGIGIMDDFLVKFYPRVLEQKRDAREDVYCKYKNEVFQLFVSSLYLGAFFASFLASVVTTRYGRKPSMLIGGLLFIVGTLLGTFATNLTMLLFGRALIGCGIGFSYQVVPIYISEIAPPQSRGAMNYFSGVFIASGVLIGNIVNYFADMVHPQGWRISLGVVGAPSIIFIIFALSSYETPQSLIQRGHHSEAKQTLTLFRGSSEVDTEFQALLEAINKQQERDKVAFTELLMNKSKRPQLVIGMAIPFFQQVSGSDGLLFYGVFLFKTAGFTDKAALYSAIITGGIGVLSISTAIFFIDRVGRKKLLIGGAFTFLTTMVTMALIFALGLKGNAETGQQRLARGEAIAQVVMLCIFVVAFASSLGPLQNVISSEVYDIDVRSVGMSVSVCVNVLFKFIIAQTFLSLLCAMKYGVFLAFAAFMFLLLVFTACFVPETKCIPLHEMENVWASHWFWKRFVPPPKNLII